MFDYGHQNGSAYLAMEYLEGESLWKRIERRRRLTLIGALRIGRQVATALAAAHDKQIVHRGPSAGRENSGDCSLAGFFCRGE